jgi:hypothetical protein
MGIDQNEWFIETRIKTIKNHELISFIKNKFVLFQDK